MEHEAHKEAKLLSFSCVALVSSKSLRYYLDMVVNSVGMHPTISKSSNLSCIVCFVFGTEENP